MLKACHAGLGVLTLNGVVPVPGLGDAILRFEHSTVLRAMVQAAMRPPGPARHPPRTHPPAQPPALRRRKSSFGGDGDDGGGSSGGDEGGGRR